MASSRVLSEESLTVNLVQSLAANLGTVILCLPVLVIGFKIIRAVCDPLLRVPGPFAARFTRLWLFSGFWSRKWHDINYQLHKKYGPVVRVAPGQFSIDDADAIKTIYGRDYKYLKSKWYKPFSFKSDGLFSVRDPHYHQVLRRKMNGVYSMTAMVTYEPYIRECVGLFLQHMDRLEGKDAVDIMHWSQCFSFDVVGMITFSHRFGFLDRGEDEMGFISAIARSSRTSMLLGVYPFLFPWVHILIIAIFGQHRAVKMLAAYTQNQMGRARKQLEDKKRDNPSEKSNPETSNTPEDFITKLLRYEDDQSSRQGVTTTEIQMGATSNMAAGSDTTGISITSVVYHLTKNPEMMKRARKELDDAAEENDLQGQLLPFSIVQKLPYLQAVIKEAERVHPAAGVPLPRVVPPEGAWLANHWFPGGSVVMVHAWTTHQNQEVWGPDASEFNPDRWLERGRAPAESQFMTFGQGSRICVGKNIAQMQIMMLVPALIQKYDYELVSEKHKDRLDADSAVFARPYNVSMLVRKRSDTF